MHGGSTPGANYTEPGSTILPLRSRTKTVISPSHDSHSEDESDESDEELPWALEFDPDLCLFCGEVNTSLNDNFFHMSKAHSFIIPYKDNLDGDIESLLGHLYLSIYKYRRCILCSTQRRTVEGIQHHMMAKGHCRFDISPDTADFYKLHQAHDSTSYKSTADVNALTRLFPPRTGGHRRTRASAKYRRSLGQGDSSPPSPPKATETEESTAPAEDKPTSSSCTQLLRLSRGDQQSLAHLSNPEVRSLLAIRARNIDQSRREETNTKLKLEKAGNITLTAHFRADTSKRFRGPWG
ncbi:hypothetical protein MGYG_06483 [Nannizzia gypsea CBS 118893]|uniref:ZN622/Rei1/Reh1 zinc finger C2H2-type domain-containing protein n=1 Tax=Arthroderma gypseum (strain ATCC MYA-4604 / CBS 118893) TaxID=535722 RepID=E4UZF5_ARTGP|nr:hypothetical protein MGYG_06483 [Nannizzia gypsea CBS 118893]EFR03485.1 hypothetical protein MGYG_06483 [Nannizzia gypsea CBS 118893]